METRELYRKKYEAQLKEWGAKVDEIHARILKTAAKAQIELKPHLEAARAKLETATSKLAQIAKATDEAWTHLLHDAEAAWNDLKASVEGAFDALRPHQKPDASALPPG